MSSTATSAPGADTDYDGIAWVYEALATVYSLGQISAAKCSQAAHFSPGDRVLYVGVGAGEDALSAARRGAHVTCIDLSAGMLRQAEEAFKREGLQAEFIVGDIFEHRPEVAYDALTANFFLNVFAEPMMLKMMAQLVTLIAPGGKLLIADYAYPRNLLAKLPQAIYWRITNFFFWAFSLCDLHPIHDYCRFMPKLDMEVSSVEIFRTLRVGPWSFYSICARKLGG